VNVNGPEDNMASNIQVVVDQSQRGITIRWTEDGLERHIWVDQQAFERFLAAGETFYMDTVAAQGHALSA
jgi:hypothetical protein